MKKIIAAINMTVDGFCDHTAVSPGEDIHQHYTDLIINGSLLLYGRVTYQLMEDAWPAMVKNPTGIKSMDDFAVAIDNVPKIVYSRTLQAVRWRNTTLKKEIVKEDIEALKQSGPKETSHNGDEKPILVGSPGLIVSLTQLSVIDEYQLCIHPVIVGKGLPLFKNISESVSLKLLKTKTFTGGAIILYYERVK